MPQRPVPASPGRDEDPGRVGEDWLAWCEALESSGQPLDPDEEDPGEDDAPLWDVDLDALIAECREVTAEEAALAARAARLGLPGGTPVCDGRRGPGQPGSAEQRPGEFGSRAAGFGAGMLLDTMPGCGALAGFAAEAAGEDDRYGGACDAGGTYGRRSLRTMQVRVTGRLASGTPIRSSRWPGTGDDANIWHPGRPVG